MRTYLELLDEVLHHGLDRDDRTGVGTRGLFGRQIRFDLEQGFPLLTTKKVHLKSCLLYTSPSPRDVEESRMPSSA